MIQVGRTPPQLQNDDVAGHLREIADLLHGQGANEFRVRAYRLAAETVESLDQQVGTILDDEGTAGLVRLPHIGRSIAKTIEQLTIAGSHSLLSRLRGDDVPLRMFATVPNIGPVMARRIHETLDIETLAELETAAHDGRLAKVPGMGRKRVQGVRESLAGRFRQPAAVTRTKTEELSVAQQPQISELLEVDRQYRHLADLDRLPRIAPRRFNPTGQAWLPILHTQRADRQYTALFSNTARAHELGTIHDWVVIYRDDDEGHAQWTVITSSYGRLRGRRIVRGREDDCREYYEQMDANVDT